MSVNKLQFLPEELNNLSNVYIINTSIEYPLLIFLLSKKLCQYHFHNIMNSFPHKFGICLFFLFCWHMHKIQFNFIWILIFLFNFFLLHILHRNFFHFWFRFFIILLLLLINHFISLLLFHLDFITFHKLINFYFF